MKPKLTDDNGQAASMVALAIYEMLDYDIVSKATYVKYAPFRAITLNPSHFKCVINLFYDKCVIKIIIDDYECSVWSRSLKFEPDLSMNISSPDFERSLNETIKRLYTKNRNAKWIS